MCVRVGVRVGVLYACVGMLWVNVLSMRALTCKSAISKHLCVLICGRKATDCVVALFCIH